MGYIKHNTIIITSYIEDSIREVREMAHNVFNKWLGPYDGSKNIMVSEVISGVVNGQYSFFISPDGSKEGWEDSNKGDYARDELYEWFLNNETYCDFIEVRFGGDDNICEIVRTV